MWPRNDGTFVTPQGHQVPQALQQLLKQPGVMPSSSNVAQVKKGDNSNVNPSNGAFHPDDEIDYSDSEFDEDCSEFDEDDSELENEAILASHLMQNQQNVYAPNSAYMASAAQASNNYSALNALSQLSTSVAPTGGMMQGQNVDAANHSAVIAALSGLTASAAPSNNMQSQQKIQNSNHNAVSAQQAMAMAQWQHQAQQAMHAHYMQQQALLASNAQKSDGKNGNNNNKGDAVSDDKKKEAIKPPPNNFRHSTPTRISTCPSRGGGIIRPRVPPYRCRNETGVDLFQLRRREFEETLTTEDDSASSSPIKDITAKLKHLKILKLFRRNKHSRETLVTISPVNADLPSIRDSGNCTESNQEDEGKSQLQKISEVLLKPSEKASIWTTNERSPDNQSNLIANRSSSYEKSVQAFLFRSNFPEHFLAIRLLQLSIDDVQQLIRQIDLLENVQDKLTETVRAESLSGPALMSCDLSELKKSLDLNLGHWTIFEQLITGLRHIQFDEILKLNIVKQTRISQEIHDDDPNSQCSSLSSESQSIADGRKMDTGGENVKMTTVGVGAQNSSPTTLH